MDLTQLGPRWWAPDETESTNLLQELRDEMPDGHVLSGVAVEAVAVKKLLKDLILWLPDSNEWAAVHLTSRTESDPQWPSTVVAVTWSGLLSEVQ